MAESSEFQPKIYYSPDGGGSSGPDALAGGDKDADLEKYLESLRGERVGERYESGHAIESVLSRHPNPETLLSSVRSLRLHQEELPTGGELPNDYVVGRQADILADRRIATSRTFEELKDEELVQELDEDTLSVLREMRAKGLLPPHMRHEAYFGKPLYSGGYGLGDATIAKKVEESWEEVSEGKKKSPRFRLSYDVVVYYGSDDQRKAYSERCGQLEAEILIRHLIMRNWRHYSINRENLTGLVQLYFNPLVTTAGLETLFNLPSVEKAADRSPSGVEFRHFGDKIDLARRLYYINALCQKPDRFKKLMQTPGWRDFVFPPGTDPVIIKEWIGNPGGWEDEDDDHLGEVRTKKDLLTENGAVLDKDENVVGYDKNLDLRGRLTRGNIFAQNNPQRDEELHASIRGFLGGGEGANRRSREEARAAQLLAYRLFKLWIEADEEGFEIYHNPEQEPSLGLFAKKELEFENGPAASDFGKLTAPSLYALKSFRKAGDFDSHRDYGPEGSFGKYPRFCASFLRATSVPVEIEMGGERIIEQRSLHELWWGYPPQQIGSVTYPEEPAFRTGDLPWAELKGSLKRTMLTPEEARLLELPLRGIHDEAMVVLYLSTYMAGREERGYYTLALQTSWDEKTLMDPSFWTRLSKAIDVGIKPGVAVNGLFRGKGKKEIKNQTGEHKRKILDTFWEGIASTANYQRWEGEYVKIGRGIAEDEKVTVVRAIRKAAAKAGVELKALPATYKLPPLK